MFELTDEQKKRWEELSEELQARGSNIGVDISYYHEVAEKAEEFLKEIAAAAGQNEQPQDLVEFLKSYELKKPSDDWAEDSEYHDNEVFHGLIDLLKQPQKVQEIKARRDHLELAMRQSSLERLAKLTHEQLLQFEILMSRLGINLYGLEDELMEDKTVQIIEREYEEDEAA